MMSVKSGSKTKIQVAEETPFDNSLNGFLSDQTQGAIEEAANTGIGLPRFPVFFWEWDSSPGWLNFLGDNASNKMPFIVSRRSAIKELSMSGKASSSRSNSILAIYKRPSTDNIPVAVDNGTLASVQDAASNVTFTEGDFPYAGSTRVTINIVNNGPNLPLVISEDLSTKIVTIQLKTDSAGNSDTRGRSDLRNTFRLNKDITLLWKVDANNNTKVQPQTIVCAGGDPGDVIASVFMRAKEQGYRRDIDFELSLGEMICTRAWGTNVNDHYPIQLTIQMSFLPD